MSLTSACGRNRMNASDIGEERQGQTVGRVVLNLDPPRISSGSTGVPAGAQSGWSSAAPAGTTLTAASYLRSLDTGNNGDSIAGLLAAGGARLDICQGNGPRLVPRRHPLRHGRG